MKMKDRDTIVIEVKVEQIASAILQQLAELDYPDQSTLICSFEPRMIKLVGIMRYKGCRNCIHQIEPLRTCEWMEQGGDGKLHLICPRWEKRGEAND